MIWYFDISDNPNVDYRLITCSFTQACKQNWTEQPSYAVASLNMPIKQRLLRKQQNPININSSNVYVLLCMHFILEYTVSNSRSF